jgi:hypothetical protein
MYRRKGRKRENQATARLTAGWRIADVLMMTTLTPTG